MQVFPTAPSPTATHLTDCIRYFDIQQKSVFQLKTSSFSSSNNEKREETE
jgi:hypothetical protein